MSSPGAELPLFSRICTARSLARGGLLLTLAACTPPTAPPSTSTETDSGAESTSLPPLTADEVGEILSALLDSGQPNATDLVGLFRTLGAAGDESCPGTDLAFTTPTSSCISETGWEYFGYAPYVDAIEDVDGTRQHRVAIVQASFVITSPEGETFSAGGGFSHVQMLDDADQTWEQVISGTFIWTGAGPTWLTEGTQVGWTLRGGRPATGHWMTLSGPLAVGDRWLYIDTLEWDAARCAGLPTVNLQVRDEAGRWYDWASGADCSPCGTVWLGDASQGSLCLDLTPTLQALDRADDLPEGA